MFDHEVLVTSNQFNIRLMKRLDLKNGRDFISVRGAVAAGRDHQLRLMFRDRDRAMVFKLQARA